MDAVCAELPAARENRVSGLKRLVGIEVEPSAQVETVLTFDVATPVYVIHCDFRRSGGGE